MTSRLVSADWSSYLKKPLAFCQKILKNKIWVPVSGSGILRPTLWNPPKGKIGPSSPSEISLLHY